MIRDRFRTGRWVLVASAAAVLATFAFAAPAMADIGVSPQEAPQGDSARLTLRIPNEHPPAYTTKVELDLPDATPVAEVYPMSVPNWAPGLTTRKLDKPTALIHGTETTEVVSAVTWVWVADPGTDPGDFQELSISLGPLPEADRLVMSVVQTYSDGTVVRWGGDDPTAGPAPTVKLVPAGAAGDGSAAGGAAGGHDGAAGGHGGAAGQGGAVDPAATHSGADASSGLGSGVGLIASIAMVIALVAAGALLMYPRRRPDRAGPTSVDVAGADPGDSADAGSAGHGSTDEPERIPSADRAEDRMARSAHR